MLSGSPLLVTAGVDKIRYVMVRAGSHLRTHVHWIKDLLQVSLDIERVSWHRAITRSHSVYNYHSANLHSLSFRTPFRRTQHLEGFRP